MVLSPHHSWSRPPRGGAALLSFKPGRGGYWIYKRRQNNLEVAQEGCCVCFFFFFFFFPTAEKVRLCDCSSWEQQRVQRSGTRRARRMRQRQPPPGSCAPSRREARYPPPDPRQSTCQIFVNLWTNMLVYAPHLSSRAPLSSCSLRIMLNVRNRSFFFFFFAE